MLGNWNRRVSSWFILCTPLCTRPTVLTIELGEFGGHLYPLENGIKPSPYSALPYSTPNSVKAHFLGLNPTYMVGGWVVNGYQYLLQIEDNFFVVWSFIFVIYITFLIQGCWHMLQTLIFLHTTSTLQPPHYTFYLSCFFSSMHFYLKLL